MALSLTTDDLTRLEAASRALLAPLTAPDPDAWVLEAGDAIRELVGGSSVVLAAPGGARGVFSEDAAHTADVTTAHVVALTTEGWSLSDPVIESWHAMRRHGGVEAFSWDLNEQMVTAAGHRMGHSPVVVDGVWAAGYRDFAGLIKTTTAGEALVWVLGRQRGGLRFGEATPTVLQALVPAFRAGLDALTRLAAHRAALDTLSEPLAAYDADGRELHRNGALTRLLAGEPQRAALDTALWRLACDLRRLAFPLRREGAAPPVPMEREVQTARGRYTLRATLLPAGTFAAGEAALVSVQADLAPPPLSPDTVRGRFGLTRREAEVAVLLAEGLPNDQIAERLFIAPGTARRHTEGVLAKLEVPTRAAVAAKLLAPA